MGKGVLKVKLFTGEQVLPVVGATVIIRDENGKELHRLVSDKNGLAEPVELFAPSPADGLEGPNSEFALYTVEIPSFEGYKRVLRHGVQIFDGQSTILPVTMQPIPPTGSEEDTVDEIFIPREHGCDLGIQRFGGQNISAMEEEIIRAIQDNNIIIPTHITVHLGSPNTNARSIRVTFADYLKNVASSEIYPTWHESAMVANILAQITFTLNRLFTVIRCYGSCYES